MVEGERRRGGLAVRAVGGRGRGGEKRWIRGRQNGERRGVGRSNWVLLGDQEGGRS